MVPDDPVQGAILDAARKILLQIQIGGQHLILPAILLGEQPRHEGGQGVRVAEDLSKGQLAAGFGVEIEPPAGHVGVDAPLVAHHVAQKPQCRRVRPLHRNPLGPVIIGAFPLLDGVLQRIKGQLGHLVGGVFKFLGGLLIDPAQGGVEGGVGPGALFPQAHAIPLGGAQADVIVVRRVPPVAAPLERDREELPAGRRCAGALAAGVFVRPAAGNRRLCGGSAGGSPRLPTALDLAERFLRGRESAAAQTKAKRKGRRKQGRGSPFMDVAQHRLPLLSCVFVKLSKKSRLPRASANFAPTYCRGGVSAASPLCGRLRQILQKCSAVHQGLPALFASSDKKFALVLRIRFVFRQFVVHGSG